MANTHKPTIATSSNKTSKPDFDVQNVSNGVLVCSPAEPCGNETIETKKKSPTFRSAVAKSRSKTEVRIP